MSGRRVLVVAPHMDDEVLGAGGTIVRHVENGDDVTVVVIANRAYDHGYDPAAIEREKRSCEAAREILGYRGLIYLDLPDERLDSEEVAVLIPLERTIGEVRPEVLYVCHWGDRHQDHRAVFRAAMIAARPHADHSPDTILAYEIPSGSDQPPFIPSEVFVPNMYVRIDGTIDRKIEAMAAYQSESREFPNPRSPEGLRIHAGKRGSEIGFKAAEAFTILKNTWN